MESVFRLHVGRRRRAHSSRLCRAHLPRGRGISELSCCDLNDEGPSIPPDCLRREKRLNSRSCADVVGGDQLLGIH